ncbi:MAG TPA: hypothetical protein K8V35_07975 [Aliicoccus persicus]|uniref:Uncharacterized protein n=1 Tax=Aliicoccus persicus TaxID=930138 RepID=A0A921DY40_9STAP|nr:hypothetical protein [Aliicoccus persicus]
MTTVSTHKGVQIGEPSVEVTTLDYVDEIIEIGTGDLETEHNVSMEEITFNSDYVDNLDLLVGGEEVS